jgi:hypothetical protein
MAIADSPVERSKPLTLAYFGRKVKAVRVVSIDNGHENGYVFASFTRRRRMTTMFQTMEAARDFAAIMAGVDPSKTLFVEDADLRITPVWLAMKIDAKLPEAEIEMDKRRVFGQQRAFRFNNRDSLEVAVVIEPFQEGFCAWGVTPSTNIVVRF